MSIRLDDETDLREDQKKNIQALENLESIFYFYFCIDQDYLFFLLVNICPD